MSHLDEGTLHALLDGEIPSAELAPIQTHLEHCAECRALLQGEREWMTEADRLVQVLEPPVRPGLGTRRSALRTRRSALGARRWLAPLAWAATVVAAAGLGYAIRGLPIGPPTPVGSEDAVKPAPPAMELAADRATSDSSVVPSVERRAPSNAGPSRGAVELPSRQAAEPPSRQAAELPSAESRPAEPANPAAAAPSRRAAERALGRLDESLRLEEVVVTSAARPAAPSALAAAKLAAPLTEPVSLPDALRRLDGTLRLIPGLIPTRLEARGDTVRVVYPTAYGDLVLAQQLRDGRIVHALIAPPGFPADSLERLRTRIRD